MTALPHAVVASALDAMAADHARRTGAPPPHDDWDHWDPTDDDAPPASPSDVVTGRESERVATTIAGTLDGWQREGPLVHEPTGIAPLDDLTGGGPVYGTRWYLAGAPDAGKTGLLVHLAHVYALRGIAVGLLAVDEDAGDLVTRLAQRIGHARSACEARDPEVLDEMRAALGDLPIRMYDARWTIESAADDLARYAADRGSRAMLGVDSLQTVGCDAEVGADMAEVAAVTARVHAIRAVATRHRLIALATSEQGRGAYASRDVGQRTTALASAKWSGAVEYGARVLVALNSVVGESDLIDAEIAKNKHGPRSRSDDPVTAHVYMRLDRRSQTLSAVSYQPPPKADAADARAGRNRERATADGESVLALVSAEPGITTRELHAAAHAAHGIGRTRVDAALRALGERIERRPGPRHSRRHYPAEGAP